MIRADDIKGSTNTLYKKPPRLNHTLILNIKIMDISKMLFIFTKIGLVLNIVGTVMIALSFGKNLADAHQLDEKGREIYLALFLHPKLFKCGLALIIVGFILQLIA